VAAVAAVILLEVQKASRRFGGIAAVSEVSLRLEEGEIRAIIGPNGAGKTTLLNMISGRTMPSTGKIVLKGEDITGLRAWQRVMRGIVYTFQITSIFPRLTCRENVALAAQRRLTAAGWLKRVKVREAEILLSVSRALDSVGLLRDINRQAGELPYGHQRLLELAMGLALHPELLILDEPTQGLAPADITFFCDLIRRTAQSTTILLVEHNLRVVLELANKITVMDRGIVLAEGDPQEIEQHPAVQQAYLGN
jgi:branched-chain amino acid transport system ATP-binding protein